MWASRCEDDAIRFHQNDARLETPAQAGSFFQPSAMPPPTKVMEPWALINEDQMFYAQGLLCAELHFKEQGGFVLMCFETKIDICHHVYIVLMVAGSLILRFVCESVSPGITVYCASLRCTTLV